MQTIRYREPSISIEDALPAIDYGVYDASGSIIEDLGYLIYETCTIKIGTKKIEFSNLHIDKKAKIIVVKNLPDCLIGFDLVIKYLLSWRQLMAGSVLPYIYAAVTLADVQVTVNATQNANGSLNVFTLPTDTTNADPVDFANLSMRAEINGVTFNAVSTLTGANAWDKSFTVADVSGTITLTFNYPPCQIAAVAGFPTPYGQLEAVVNTSSPSTPLALPVVVGYNALG